MAAEQALDICMLEGCQQPNVISLAEHRSCVKYLRDSYTTSKRRSYLGDATESLELPLC